MKLGDCRNFNGIQNDACKAGVRYDSFAVGAKPCLPVSFPDRPCGQSCAKFEAVTPEDVAAREAQVAQSMERMRQNLSTCCAAPIDDSQLIKSGRYKGSGWLFCTQCKKAYAHVHGRGERRR